MKPCDPKDHIVKYFRNGQYRCFICNKEFILVDNIEEAEEQLGVVPVGGRDATVWCSEEVVTTAMTELRSRPHGICYHDDELVKT